MPRFLPGGIFQTAMQGEESLAEHHSLAEELRKQREFREAEVASSKTEFQEEISYANKGLQKSAWDSSESLWNTQPHLCRVKLSNTRQKRSNKLVNFQHSCLRAGGHSNSNQLE